MMNYLVLALTVLAFFLAGCAEEVSAPQQTVRPSTSTTTKKATADKQKEEPGAERVPVYAYNSIGKRDPFTSPLANVGVIDGQGDEPLTPLQRYDVGQFRLSGVVLGMSVPKAMVSSPDGKTYIISIGTKVGKNGGKVTQINNDGVLVEETLRDFSGETRINTVLIALPKRKGV